MGEGMRKNGVAILLLAVSLGLPLAACQDTKARQENEQLKGQLTDLQKQNADLSGRVDALAKENSDLSAENEKLKAQIPHKKVAAKGKKKRHRSASSS
jgi:regulator of replication initiation timing